jgi:hypothetical protein
MPKYPELNKLMKAALLVFFVFTGNLLFAGIKVQKTLCEYRVDPLGVDNRFPGLSWISISDQRNVRQTAYRILVADDSLSIKLNRGNFWDSKKVLSDQSVQIEYKGKPLSSAKTYYWKVMVWDNYGNASAWSKTGKWQMGLLTKDDWHQAQWIAYQKIPDSSVIVPGLDDWDDKRWNKGNDILPVFRKQFKVTKSIKSAAIFITGLGQFELSINGKKIGDHFLDPGWTKYGQHALYVTFDVTRQLQNEANAIGVMLGNGFYYIPGERYHKIKQQFGYPKMICRMVIQYQDGSEDNIISDDSWKAAPGPITFSSIYGGEDYNANLEIKGWKNAGFNGDNWSNAITVDGPPELDAQVESPLKIFEEFTPKKISRPKPGVWIYDMGQNCSAVPFISLKGKKGSVVKIVPGELLDTNGMVTQEAIGSPVYFNYTLSGDSVENWHPQFMYYGFRYIQVEGGVPATQPDSSGLPVILKVKSLHTRNAAQKTGSFHCSNDLFNKTFNLIDWAVQSNMASILTDCPHREKLGWLEETNLMGNSIQYNYDLATLFHKVVRDMMHSQTSDGLIPSIAPEYVKFGGGFRDSPEWGSSGIILPYDIYKWYNDKKLLAESYTMMKNYTKYLNSKAINHILNCGLGDWYDIGPKDPGYSQLTPGGITATATFYYDLNIMTEVARILGKYDDENWYKNVADSVKIAYNQKFFNKNTGEYGTGSQTANAMSVFMGLVDEQDEKRVVDHIVTDIRKHNNGVTAGDIGFRYLLKVLNDEGRSDVIFDMNSRSDVPGYGYQLKKGATALTESWQGNSNSSNDHFMLGHLMEWFYSGLAGISQQKNTTGYHDIIIRPEVVGDVTNASATYASSYGEIKNAWKKNGDIFVMYTTVPVNSSALIYLPSGNNSVITEGGRKLSQVKDVSLVGYRDGKTILKVGSGSYSFMVK